MRRFVKPGIAHDLAVAQSPQGRLASLHVDSAPTDASAPAGHNRDLISRHIELFGLDLPPVEYAVAPVQANPDALVESVSKMLNPRQRFLPLAALATGFEEAIARELSDRRIVLKAIDRVERRLGRV